MSNLEEFGELALIVGDFHIPQRACDVPDQFKELLAPNKVQHLICTGNVGNRESLDWLKSLSNNFVMVKGDHDDVSLGLQETKTINIGNYKIGLIHGHQIIPWGDQEALNCYIREMDVDLLISGHTHEQNVSSLEGKYFVNPGSATGSYGPLSANNPPSFVLLEFKESQITVYTYQFVKGETKIDKIVLPKKY